MFFVALRVVAPAVDQSSTHDVDAARSRLVVDLNAVAVARWSFDADVPTCRAAVASTTTFFDVVRRRPFWSVASCCHVLLHDRSL